MNDEAIQGVATRAVENAHPRIVQLNGDQYGRYLVTRSSGQIEEHRLEIPDRIFQCEDLRSLIELAVYPPAPYPSELPPAPMIFVGREVVDLVFNPSDGRERARLCLVPSGEWKWIEEQNGAISHTGILHTLRYGMREAAPKGLRDKILAMKWTTGHEVTTRTGRGEESMGKQVNAQVQSGGAADNMPAEVQMFNVLPYGNIACDRVPVEVYLDPDPSAEQWWLVVNETSMDAAVRYARNALVKALKTLLEGVGEKGDPAPDVSQIQVLAGTFETWKPYSQHQEAQRPFAQT